MFVFRNNTIERFFPEDYLFSGYDDISYVPVDVNGYVWFYQLPVKYDKEILCSQIRDYTRKLLFVLEQVDKTKLFIALTMDEGAYSVPFSSGIELVEAIAEYNISLVQLATEHSNVKILDFREFTRQYPANEVFDWKFWFISQMGISPKITKPFRAWFQRKLDEIAYKRKKCLVLDLDNTLWGGVLGEEGIDGIKLGGDYPGKAFTLFQEALLELSKSGVILAVCSKNDEQLVFDAWDKNPSMVLKRDNFASWRINWNDKVSNIRELASELNIGLDSVVFVDDNPSERELVRQFLPMVDVPAFPSHPYDLPLFLKELVEKYFRVYSITNEDKKKTELYKAKAKRSQERLRYADIESFLKSLDIRIRIEAANEYNIPRIAQLTQKTNQFNLTSKRYSDTDIRRCIQEGWIIWCVGVADKFGDDGISGCVIITPEGVIDTFLLSCRVLGKGIEVAFAKKILLLLKEAGFETIQADYLPTPKNGQAAGFYAKLGFDCMSKKENGSRHYSMDISSYNTIVDDYYYIEVIK